MKLRKAAGSEHEFLIQSIQSARRELHEADRLFNQLSDAEAVDYASYSLLAAKAKYSYLLKLAKEKHISL